MLTLKDDMVTDLHYVSHILQIQAAPRGLCYTQHHKPSKTTFYYSLQFLPEIPEQSSSQQDLLPLESKGILLLRIKS